MTTCSEYDIVDVAVIGAGPAGLSAGMYAARAGLKTVIFGDPYASQLAKADPVENFVTWTGSPSGIKIIEKMLEHAEEYDAILEDNEIKQIARDREGHFQVYNSDGESTCAYAVILCTGTKYRKLGVTDEDEYYGKGVNYCTLCDGPLYKGETVAVIGHGEEMAQSALRMTDIADQLYVLATRPRIGADPSYVEQLEQKDNVILVEGTRPIEIGGTGDEVTKYTYKKGDTENEIKVSAVFIEMGVLPSTAIASGLGLNLDGNFVQVDEEQRTNVDGFYAAGDITGGESRQAIVSSGDGARAAISAINYIKKLGVSSQKLKTTQWGGKEGKTKSKQKKEKDEKSTEELADSENPLIQYVFFDDGFTKQMERYNLNTEPLEKIGDKLDGYQLITISAHWCPDCRRNVPRMAKISEKFGWDIIVEDRDKEGVREKYNVKKIPTFILKKDGKEKARIIEEPKYGSLEEDLLKIVNDEY